MAPLTTPGAGSAEQLIAYCRTQLAHDQCPRTVDVVDHIPRNGAGKILLGALREAYR